MAKGGRGLAIPALIAMCAAAAWGEASEAFSRANRSVVAIVAANGPRDASMGQFLEEETPESRTLGSGIVLSEDGLILTANHAVSGSGGVAVVLWDMTEAAAEIVTVEERLDVAVVRINRRDLVPLPWREDQPARVGETVYAIGTPSAFGADPSPSISRGIISALHRTIGAADGNGYKIRLADLIETDAQLSPGESGGALVDAEGRLLGMCLAVYRPHGSSRGRAYAVPADAWLRRALDALVKGREAPIGDLGAQVSTLTGHRARLLKVPPRIGVEVTWREQGGPFERAGVLVGDVVTAINGLSVRRTTRFRQLEMRLEPGSAARVSVIRPPSRKPVEFDVPVACSSPDRHTQEAEFAWRGMRVGAVSDELRRKFAMHYRDAVVVTRIESRSSAYRAGLRAGDAIVEINNAAVKTVADFRRAVSGIPSGNVVRVRTTKGIGHIQGESLPK